MRALDRIPGALVALLQSGGAEMIGNMKMLARPYLLA